MIILQKGELQEKYGYSNIDIKKATPAEKDPEYINTFIVSLENWFVIKISGEEFKTEEEVSKEFNRLLEEKMKELEKKQ